MECKVCKKTKNVKCYGQFCGIELCYCPEHNYLFREIQILNIVAQGSTTRIKQQYIHNKRKKIKIREEKWKQTPII